MVPGCAAWLLQEERRLRGMGQPGSKLRQEAARSNIEEFAKVGSGGAVVHGVGLGPRAVAATT